MTQPKVDHFAQWLNRLPPTRPLKDHPAHVKPLHDGTRKFGDEFFKAQAHRANGNGQ